MTYLKTTKATLTLILATLYSLAYGQDKIIINQPFFGLPSYQTETIEIDSLKQLPTKIQFITEEIIKRSMTDFVDNIQFVKGQIIDLDNWLINDSISQTEYDYVVPKYQLFFELTDSIIGIKKYCFELSLDQYGQVIYFEWPREYYNKRETFISPQLVKKEAIKFSKSKKYKTDSCLYELKYDNELSKLCWHLSFLQFSSGNEYRYSKEYKTIVIDATLLTVLKEFDMCSVGTD